MPIFLLNLLVSITEQAWSWRLDDGRGPILFPLSLWHARVQINILFSFLHRRMLNQMNSLGPNLLILHFMWHAVRIANFSTQMFLIVGTNDQSGACIENFLWTCCSSDTSLSFNRIFVCSQTSWPTITFNVTRCIFLPDHDALIVSFSTWHKPLHLRCRQLLNFGNELWFSIASKCCFSRRPLTSLFYWCRMKHALFFPSAL